MTDLLAEVLTTPNMTAAITGPRPQNMGRTDSAHYASEIARTLDRLRPVHFSCGMALGIDMIGAELALLRDIDVFAYVPFAGQDNIWPDKDRALYRSLVKRAARTITIEERPLPDDPKARRGFVLNALFARNIKMVHNADIVIGCWDRLRAGGTAHALAAAVTEGKPVVLITPGKRTCLLTPEQLTALVQRVTEMKKVAA